MIPLEPYELMQMLHFINKLKLLIDNCPRTLLNDNNNNGLRVSVPLIQTKDAIEQLKSHLNNLVTIGTKLEEVKKDRELTSHTSIFEGLEHKPFDSKSRKKEHNQYAKGATR